MRDWGVESGSLGLDPYAILSRTTSMTFTFVPAIQAMFRSSSSICVANVAVTSCLLLQYTPAPSGAGFSPARTPAGMPLTAELHANAYARDLRRSTRATARTAARDVMPITNPKDTEFVFRALTHERSSPMADPRSMNCAVCSRPQAPVSACPPSGNST